MDLNELIVLKQTKTAELNRFIEVGETEQRELTSEETNEFSNVEKEIRELEQQIELKNNNTNKIINREKNMNTEFKELLVRNGDTIENFKVRAITLSTAIDNVQVVGDISSVGYEPFYKNMGVSILPNLTTSIKLPYVSGIISAKKGEGVRYDNDKTLATVTLQPSRYTITETIGRELLAVGNEAALQNYLLEMVKGVDRAITKDIFDIAMAGATAVTGLTTYTTTNLDTLIATVDGNTSLLMPRAEFYKAKAVKVDTYSNLFLANRTNEYSGTLWDGTPLFYSQLFSGSSISVVELKHITVGEFGSTYEIIFDNFSKAPEGQVVVTVVREAGVVLRNANAVRKATIA